MSLKDFILSRLKEGSILRIVLGQIRRSPLSSLIAVPYAVYLTKVATGRFFPVRFVYSGRFIPVKISKAKTGKILIEDKIILESWGQRNNSISIIVDENALLKVGGEFIIGQGCLIMASSGAVIKLNGRLDSTGSGITCDTRIMAERSIEIGYDCIIAWDCCITDSNWHHLADSIRCRPVSIGNRVWIGHGVSILPGAKIGDGCVIGAKSLVLGKEYRPLNLLVGNPARPVRENVNWSR